MKLKQLAFLGFLGGLILLSHAGATAQTSPLLTKRVVKPDDDGSGTKNWYFAGGAGYSNRLGKLMDSGSPEANEFVSRLQHGYGVHLSLSYLFKEYWGLGLHSDLAQQRAHYPGTMQTSAGPFSNYTETNTFYYVGPTFAMRFKGRGKMNYFFDTGLGPLIHSIGIQSNELNGHLWQTVLGRYVGVSASFDVSPGLGAGLKLSASGGSKTEELPTGSQKISLMNIMVSGIFVFKSREFGK